MDSRPSFASVEVSPVPAETPLRPIPGPQGWLKSKTWTELTYNRT